MTNRLHALVLNLSLDHLTRTAQPHPTKTYRNIQSRTLAPRLTFQTLLKATALHHGRVLPVLNRAANQERGTRTNQRHTLRLVSMDQVRVATPCLACLDYHSVVNPTLHLLQPLTVWSITQLTIFQTMLRVALLRHVWVQMHLRRVETQRDPPTITHSKPNTERKVNHLHHLLRRENSSLMGYQTKRMKEALMMIPCRIPYRHPGHHKATA
mmetsp:Transcript_20605/g.22883  ORF Transcript_20605/g.22883 Transcript_20605/m.22883 type:complete len:211 (+) Transcript_20605:3349-3981(+)